MIFLSDIDMETTAGESGWQPWDLKKFEKLEDDHIGKEKDPGDNISEKFESLFERVEIKKKGGFKSLYLAEKKVDDAASEFVPVGELDKPEEEVSDDEPVEIPEIPESLEGPVADENHESEFSEPEVGDDIEAGLEPEPAAPEIELPDLEGLKQKAYEEGFQKGETEGLASGKSQIEEIVGRLGTIISDIEAFWPDLVSLHEEKILSLVCKISEQVVYGQVQIDNEVVKKSILEAFRILPEPEKVSIFINNEDYDYIETVKDDIFKDAKDLKQVSIISDESITRGGCRVESEKGDVDATLESRLGAIKENIIAAGNPG